MCFVRPYTYATVFYYRSVCLIHQKGARTPLESMGVAQMWRAGTQSVVAIGIFVRS